MLKCQIKREILFEGAVEVLIFACKFLCSYNSEVLNIYPIFVNYTF